MSLDLDQIRSEFPALEQKVNGHDLIYLDSAATSLKPRKVIDRLNTFYSYEAANVHRGAHYLSDRATDLYEQARQTVASFINAASSREIIFVRGTTEGLNLISNSLGESLQEGDEIIVSDIEHHANIVPWQILAKKKSLTIKALEADSSGHFDSLALEKLINDRTKILAITHASNHLGSITNIDALIKIAHLKNITVVVDGAQAVGKLPIDVRALDADFYTFSGHKMFAPFGIGVVYGKESIIKNLPPYQGGGSMITTVSFSGTTFNDIPFRFEAGTPNVGGAVALSAAIEFINEIGLDAIQEHDFNLTKLALEQLSELPDLSLLGPKSVKNKIPVFAFNLNGFHGSDVGFILNQQGIAVRTGHHCTQPLLKKLGISGSIRASFSIYNTPQEIDALIAGLKKAKELLT